MLATIWYVILTSLGLFAGWRALVSSDPMPASMLASFGFHGLALYIAWDVVAGAYRWFNKVLPDHGTDLHWFTAFLLTALAVMGYLLASVSVVPEGIQRITTRTKNRAWS